MATPTLEELKRQYGLDSSGPQQPAAPMAPRTPAVGGAPRSGGPPSLADLKVQYGLEEPEQGAAARFVSELPEPVREFGGGAIRNLASALEPVQFLQDGMFATIAGSLDSESTISERLSTMNWRDYLPYGEVPERPASGEEIFTLLGFDERTAKWAGIAADITVDPLVFGSWLRVAGKLGSLDDLVRLGDKVDDFMSPIGMGRMVNNQARKSQYISDFMDARMETLMRAFRNPDSTVLGIQRFGERSTRLLERALPTPVVDRLRFGREIADELADARRSAAATGKRVNEENLRMLHRATYGFSGEESKQIMRSYLKSMEDQRKAWVSRLETLDPTVREVVEKEVYDAIRPDGNKQAGIGLMAFLGGEDDIARVFTEGDDLLSSVDASVRKVTEETYGAVREMAEGMVSSPRRGDPSDLFRVHSDKIQERLDGARSHVGATARERARSAGLSAEKAHMAEAEAVRAFNGYLADTLQIDARLGHAMSGYDFIGNMVRSRANELAGNLDTSQSIWNRVLRRGLLEGQDGIERLKGESTGISLRQLANNTDFTPEEVLRRRQVYDDYVQAESARIFSTPSNRTQSIGIYVDEVDEIASRAEELASYIKSQRKLVPDLNQATAVKSVNTLERRIAEYRDAAAKVLEAGADAPKAAVSRMLQLEEQLGRQVRRVQGIMNNAAEKPASWYPRYRTAKFEMELGQSRADELAENIMTLSSQRQAARKQYLAERAEEVTRQASEMAAARQRAQAAADRVVPPRTAGEPQGYLTVHGEQYPLAGRNTTGEDILAIRMRSGQYGSLEDAAKDPVTFGELLDGAADMQALKIGEYLQGLMNGHLRRTYALFGDTNDFKHFIDSLRAGTIIPSNVLNTSDLPSLMKGYEREAKLILDYQAVLTRNGKGLLLKKSSIAEYLTRSGVPPERVNGAIRSMAQALSPDNEAMKTFLYHVDAMAPKYRKMMADRERSIAGMAGADTLHVTDRRFFDPISQISEDQLIQMGEIAQARASLGDSIEIANRVVGRQEMFQNIYEVAKRRGLIRSAEYTDEFGVKYVKYADGEAVMGGFAGKYIHPHLMNEMQRAAAVKKNMIPYAYTRMRALITGGFLAAPSVIAANFFGGLYQAGTVGINPATMIRRLIEVADEVNAYSLGYRSNLVSEIRRNVDIDLGSLPFQDFGRELRKVRLDDFGLGPQGVNKVFDDVSQAYERFLRRPGIGPIRTRVAGLEGFQFTENWFKVAAYKEVKERLLREAGEGIDDLARARIEKEAAEFARTVVFDYSELPSGLDFLKQTGLVLFPGFTYFLAGRTLDAALRRPGALAVADRLSEAVANATLDIEEQIMALTGSPDWLRDDQGVPMPFSVRRGPRGEEQVSMLPLNQLIPTSTLWDGWGAAGNPWGESIAGLGLMGPFFEVFRALVTDDGEAVLSARYGNRVFDADSEGGRKARDVFRFLYNTLAPSNVKKLITLDMENQLSGLLPSMAEIVRDHAGVGSQELMDRAYSFEEHRRLRPDRGWRESVLSTFLRSPQVVALEGPIAGFIRELRNEQARLGEELTMLRRRANRARAEGNMEAYERWANEIRARQTEFNNKWRDFLEFQREFQRRRLPERGQ